MDAILLIQNGIVQIYPFQNWIFLRFTIDFFHPNYRIDLSQVKQRFIITPGWLNVWLRMHINPRYAKDRWMIIQREKKYNSFTIKDPFFILLNSFLMFTNNSMHFMFDTFQMYGSKMETIFKFIALGHFSIFRKAKLYCTFTLYVCTTF